MSVSVPNIFTANTKIQSAQVNANFTAVLALTPITTLGDLVYASSSTAMSRLAGNTTTTRKFLLQVGDGVNSAAPSWSQVAAATDITGQLPIANGGTGAATASANQAFIGPASGSAAAPSFRALGLSDLPSAFRPKNYLANAGFDYWQRTTSPAVLTGSNGGTTYQYGADRWYVANVLGGSGTTGQITNSRVAASAPPALYANKLLITRAPVGSPVNGCELWQVIENPLTLELYNQTVVSQFSIKAFGNVNQVGVQYFYATSEAKPTTGNTIGSEQTFTVSTGSFTTCTLTSQALGTSMTTSGVVGVRIRITGVSSGNTYDVNNGFSVEQPGLWIGTTVPAAWSRMGATPTEELAYCQRFYAKSYDTDTNPATASTTNGAVWAFVLTVARARAQITFPVTMRTATPTMLMYSTNDGSSSGGGQVYNVNATANAAISAQATGKSGSIWESSAAFTAGDRVYGHYTADGDI